MKATALDTLLVAKSILGEAKSLIELGDRHSSTAGIIVLQDFVELIVLALLDEKDVDSVRSLESKSFDELLGELKKHGVPVVKSGTIKALNKQRVICKHYGQLSDPGSVVNYLNVALQFSEAALISVYGKGLQEIFATDLLQEGEVKSVINSSIASANEGDYLAALSALRKAFFLAYEYNYCIYGFRNDEIVGFAQMLMQTSGYKAPNWCKTKDWISKNVKTPLDYIQVNHDQLKGDCLDWGVSVADVGNFRRLTPGVVKLEGENWHLDYELNYAANELNADNYNYCLDVLLGVLLAKQRYDARHKWPKRVKSAETPPVYIGKPVYSMPCSGGQVVMNVPERYWCSIERCVTGFNSSEKYFYIHLHPQEKQEDLLGGHVWGYVLVE